MPASPAPLDTLLLRWRGLSHADRRAILHHLPADQQAEFLQALGRARLDGHSARGRYAAFSPWLAELLQACAKETSLTKASPLRPLASEALRQAYAKVEEQAADGRPSSLFDLIRTGLAKRGLLP